MCQPYCVLNGLADLVFLQAVELLLELGHESAGAGPAEVAAVGGRARILRSHRGDRGEVLAAVQDALADVAELLLDRLIVFELVGAQQDVTGVHLRDHRLLHAAAHFVQAEQVEAARRADRLRDFAGLHLRESARRRSTAAASRGASRASRLRCWCCCRST